VASKEKIVEQTIWILSAYREGGSCKQYSCRRLGAKVKQVNRAFALGAKPIEAESPKENF